MRVYRLYVDADLFPGAVGTLEPGQARQVTTVLRHRPGDQLTLFNGSGIEAASLLTGKASYEVISVFWPQREMPLRLSIGLAMLRGERFEIALQKLTEIGAARVVPIQAQRSVVSFADARAWEKRRVRLRRIAQEAAEQAERVTLPEIAEPVTVTTFLEREQNIAALVERAGSVLLADLPFGDALTLMIGPEGGWSDDELRLIAEQTQVSVSLGTLVLRAETAAIVAAGTVAQRSWSQNKQGEM